MKKWIPYLILGLTAAFARAQAPTVHHLLLEVPSIERSLKFYRVSGVFPLPGIS